VRSPGEGYLVPKAVIGDHVVTGQVLGFVDSKEVFAPLDGVLRGLIHETVKVKSAMKIGDIDPRDNKAACWSISDKARALGGSVLEAYCTLSGGIKCAE
jgi:xanthine dehydrogenase accessory factor